jgi:hypothetical protein
VVLIFDASNEGEAISSALQQRGFAVGRAPLALLESRLLSDSPSVMLIDVDQPGVLEAVERVGELSLIHRVVLVFLGDPAHEDSLRKVGASGKLFPRPVDIDVLVDHVATYATPIHKVSRVRESSVPEASSPRDTMPPPTNDSDSPAAVDYTSNQDPFDIESILPFGEDVLKPPADLPTRLSPELEQLMLSAERRVGTLVHRSSMPPPDEEDASLPPEYLSILDEPLESEEDDSFVGFPSFDGTPGPPESDDEPESSPRAETDKRPLVPEAPALQAVDEGPPTPVERGRRPREVVERDEPVQRIERPREGLTRNEPASRAERPREGLTRNEPASRAERPREGLTRNEPASRAERPREGLTRNEPASRAERPREGLTRNEPASRAERPLPAPARLPEETPKAGTYLGQQLEAMSRASASSGRSGDAAAGERSGTSRSIVAPPTQVAPGRSGPMSHPPATEAMMPGPFSRADDAGDEDSPRRSVVTRAGYTRSDVDSSQGVPSIGGATFPEMSARYGGFVPPPPEVTHRTPSAAPPPPVRPPAAASPAARARAPMPAPPLPSPPVPARPAERAGPDAAPIPQAFGEGDAPLTLARAIAGRTSGSLALTSDAGIRRVVLQDGDVVTAASWVADETLLAFLAARGDIERDLLPQLEGKLPAYGRIAGAALIARGHLGQDDLWPVLRAHAEWIIGRALLTPSGTCELETEPPARLTQEPNVFGGATGAEVLIESVRRVIPPETAMARIGGPRARVSLGPRQSLLSECALRPDEAERIRSAQGRSVGELVERADAEMPNVLYALACLGVIEVLRAVAPPREEPPPEPDPYDEEAVRQRVRARIALVEDGDYFSLLGVAKAATSYEIRRAYLELRRAFEPSRLLTAATADLHSDVQLILQVLDEAFDILRDPHRRERYRRAIESAGPS